jgi:acetyltransferase-like isoleucine patch superfamily enzyme
MLKNQQRNKDLRNSIIERFISGVMTDDERAELFGLPEGCRIREGAKIISPDNFKCGKYVWIGENAVLDASGGLEIGDHTSIGLTVFIWSHTSYLANVAVKNFIASDLIERKPTKIGSGCFIGGPSVIYHNVTIGNKVVILPMSVVTKDIPDYSIVGGSPARIIKTLSEEDYGLCCKTRLHNRCRLFKANFQSQSYTRARL